MNKSFIVIVLAALQCACVTQGATPTAANSLLSFTEIAAEITVEYNETAEAGLARQATAADLVDSP